ncbi:MAG: EAL domain-containing protein [Lachnospiraceae bacterium]|nr:EAL domain-containing protein [Lachnospiraceae bacterium]
MNRYDITKFDLEKKYIQNSPAEMPGGFLVYRADDIGEILYANVALLNIYGCKTTAEFMQLTGGVFSGMVHPDDREAVLDKINGQILSDEGRYDQVNYRICTLSGKELYVADYGKLVHDPEYGDLFYVFITTSRSRLDGLTGLLMDWYFLEVAKDALDVMYKAGHLPVILSFDFIGMKGFNGKYGREEGDKLLIQFANLIAEKFTNGRCSRFGEDHFYAFTDSRNIEKRLNELIVECHEFNGGRNLPVKIGICKYIPGVSVSTLCDWANLACESKKSYYSSGFEWFDDDMARNFDKREYILSQIDRALIDGSIQVYYQPVIRSMTGELASFEALVRWQDKRYGMISPGEFIPVLEENGLSYKVDRFVINHVAAMLQEKISVGENVVPISVNISQTDFEMMDPVEVLVNATDEKSVPRGLMVVEITETALVSDNGIIKNAIDRFHSSGFEVWMDDFGSGYSSLNVLKDYSFDEIKIDMIFMRNFDEKSKTIVKAAVKMAKSLGIHTLAEGVENKEQISFLREIGCEKMQGYLFGKPMPLDEAISNVYGQNVGFETRAHAGFYDAVGLRNLPDDLPVALFHFANNRFKLLYQNEKYKKIITSDEVTGDEAIEWNMNSNQSGLSVKFRNLANKASASNKRESMTFVDRNRYYYFAFEKVVSKRDEVVLEAEIHETDYRDIEKLEGLDVVSRNITTMFDAVYLIDYENDTDTVIYTTFENEESGTVYEGADAFYERSAQWQIYYDDVDRFNNEFANKTAFTKLLKESNQGSFSEQFRLKNSQGNYGWKEFIVIALPESGGMRYLVCIRPAYIEGQADKMAVINRLVNNLENICPEDSGRNYDYILEALIRDADIKMFWKDTDRRFTGASQSFLNYYGFKSEKDILGKTDEDIGWHINDIPFMEIEKDILEHGKVYKNIRGENVINGVLHNIMAWKFPVYNAGRITGLVGYFIDLEQDIGEESGLHKVSTVDEATGLMNVYGMLLSVIGYDNNFRENREDYVYATLHINEYESIVRDFGSEIAHGVKKHVSIILNEVFNTGGSIAHISSGDFAVAIRGISQNEISEKLVECCRRVEDVHTINGRKVRLSMRYGFAFGSEYENVRGVVKTSMDRLAEMISEKQKLMIEEMEEFDLYNDIPLPFAIMRLCYEDEAGGPKSVPTDLSFVYVNSRYCELSGYGAVELVNKRYIEIFKNTNDKWMQYGQRASRGELVNERAYSASFGGVVEFVAAPAMRVGEMSVLFKTIDLGNNDRYQKETELDTYKIVFKSCMRLEKYIYFDDVTNLALEEIGEMLDADRTFIIEKVDGTASIIHEWVRDKLMIIPNGSGESDFVEFNDFMKASEEDGLIKVNDVQELREKYPIIYNYFRSMGVYNSIMAPLYLAGSVMGYICIDNYNLAQEYDINLLVKLYAKYVSRKIAKKIVYENSRANNDEKDNVKTVISNHSLAGELAREIADKFDFRKPFDETMISALQLVLDNVMADRVYILEIDRGIVNNIYEVCKDGVSSERNSLQNLEYDKYYKPWENMLKDDNLVVIENVDVLKKISHAAYVTIARRGISRMIAAPYYYNGKIMGFLCADNYDGSYYQKTKSILQMVSKVIGARCVANYFQQVNSFDDLTGVHNRNAMLNREDEVRQLKESVGIVFADLNGLKRINDEQGHEAGDDFIRRTANILIDIYGRDNIFRSGGDEFMVILAGLTLEEFEQYKTRLKDRLDEEQAPEVAVGFQWDSSSQNIDKVTSLADKHMYEDKNRFYINHERYRT